MQNYEVGLYEAMESIKNSLITRPLNLGGVSGPGGGGGGPSGGVIGNLPQIYISFDSSELADNGYVNWVGVYPTGSGNVSLLDNLNHIRYRLHALEIGSGSGGGGGHIIQDEGSPLAQRSKLNFVGAGVTVTDDSGNDRTIVTIPLGSGGSGTPLTVKEIDGSPSITNVTTLEFTNGAVSDQTGGVVRIAFALPSHTHGGEAIVSGIVSAAYLGAGVRNGTKFLRDDNTWQSISISGGGHTIEKDSTPFTQRSKLNFIGANITVVDDAGNDATNITISGIGSVTTSGVSGDYSYYVDGALGTSTKVYNFVATRDFTIDCVTIYVDTKGSSGSTIIDVNKNGTTLYSTQGNRPTVDFDSADGISSTTPDIVSIAKYDIISIDIDSNAVGASNLFISISPVGTTTGSSSGGVDILAVQVFS